jgi:hypothetical protein
MADILLPTGGGHFFTPDALAKAITAAEANHPGKANVLQGAVDADGVKVVLVLGSQDGRWKVATSFAKDWTGSQAFGATGSVAW